MAYLYQVCAADAVRTDGLPEPYGWREWVMTHAATHEQCAMAAARLWAFRAGGCEPRTAVVVFVADAKSVHPNGQPLSCHRFDLVLSPESHREPVNDDRPNWARDRLKGAQGD